MSKNERIETIRKTLADLRTAHRQAKGTERATWGKGSGPRVPSGLLRLD
jgi:hypothetical protein